MRVLVTGHQGYLGSVMVPALVAAGHEVHGLDTGLFAASVIGPPPEDPPAVARDLRDITPADLAGFDAVVHLAALSNDPLGSLVPELTYDINHHASSRLGRLARDAGVSRFLYASTCSVYGASGTSDALTEDAPMRPVTPYAESKVRVEDDLIALADEHFTPVLLRNATAFGFSPRLRCDIVLNNLVAHAVLADRILVTSDGTPWRPLVHAADIASAFTEALVAPREAVHAQAFNIGSDANNVQVTQIAEAVAEAVPTAELMITGETGGDPRSYRVDFAKVTAAMPSWRARWSIADGAAELVAAYRTHGLTQDGFTRRFTRLAWLRHRQELGELDLEMRLVD